MTSRREFIVKVSLGGAVLAGAGHAHAQGAMVAESDPQATGLGYKAEIAHSELPFQHKAADAAGGCPIFAGKQVAGKGWCSAWAKKA